MLALFHTYAPFLILLSPLYCPQHIKSSMEMKILENKDIAVTLFLDLASYFWVQPLGSSDKKKFVIATPLRPLKGLFMLCNAPLKFSLE